MPNCCLTLTGFWLFFFFFLYLQEVEINRKRPTFIKAKERVAHVKKKLESAHKSLSQAQKAHDAHEEDISVLQRELEAVEGKRLEYEEQVAGESQSQGRDVELEENQVRPRSVNRTYCHSFLLNLYCTLLQLL